MTEYLDRYPTMHEYSEGKRINPKLTDLISRADAIEAVKDTILKRFNLADWYEEMLNCGVEIEDRIKALPSADAVQGEWIYRWNEVECSVCGEFAKDKSNFCPNCGARMDCGAKKENTK